LDGTVVISREKQMNVIELENITKTFGSVKAVDSLSLGVPKGSIYGFSRRKEGCTRR
jgi:ABC-type uncharacterized transport system ATPase subunit